MRIDVTYSMPVGLTCMICAGHQYVLCAGGLCTARHHRRMTSPDGRSTCILLEVLQTNYVRYGHCGCISNAVRGGVNAAYGTTYALN